MGLKQRVRTTTAVCLGGWLALLLVGGWCSAALAADAAATQAQIRRLQGDIKTFRQQLDSTSGEQKRQQQQLEQLEVEAGQVNRRLDRIGAERQQLQQQIGDLKTQQTRLQQTQQQQAQALGEQLALAFRSGQQDRLKLLLNQEDPQRVARLLRYHGYFSAARVEALSRYNQTLEQLQGVDASLHQREAALATQQQELQRQQQKLVQLRSNRKTLLAELEREIKQQSRQLQRLEADRARLQKVLDALQQALAKADLAITTQRFAQLKGRLRWPTNGKVVQRYGAQVHGVQTDGMLIGSRAGEVVQAVHNGRVVYSDWLRGYGLVLILDHGDGYMSLYGHNQSLLKEVGDWVAAGEIIAKVGDSGGQAQTGLYFAIRRNGKPQNPQPWLNRKRG